MFLSIYIIFMMWCKYFLPIYSIENRKKSFKIFFSLYFYNITKATTSEQTVNLKHCNIFYMKVFTLLSMCEFVESLADNLLSDSRMSIKL